MEFMKGMPFSEAQQLLGDHLTGIATTIETIALSTAVGRVTAVNMLAREAIPPFARSTVDGFAVRSMDVYVAGEGIPIVLNVVGEVLMGSATSITLSAGQAAVIPTGGMLPQGADAVVMLEYTETPDEKTVLVIKPVAPGENVIACGEDMQTGGLLVSKGQRMTPGHIGALAACGFQEIKVYQRLRVAVLSSGNEVVEIAANPMAGQVRDINSYALAAMLDTIGCVSCRYGIVPDEYAALLATLRMAVDECDMVLVSGGSSVGARDYTVQAITALGEPGLLFHGLAVKPGKPTICGLIGRVPVFGLPGHPVSAMTICEQLVKPVAEQLSGCVATVEERLIPARISRSIASAPGRDDFQRVRLRWQNDGYVAEPVLGKSGLISTMLSVDGIIRIKADCGGLYAGDPVLVQLL